MVRGLRSRSDGRRRGVVVAAAIGGLGATLALTTALATAAHAAVPGGPPRPFLPTATGAIKHVIVIDLENKGFAETFGPDSPAPYLNHTLLPQGELLSGYYAIGHVSQDNYAAQISGQAPNAASSADCVDANGAGRFDDLVPGTQNPDQRRFPGQADGTGCVFPRDVRTIGDQLSDRYRGGIAWRGYAGDMGNDPARDGGTPDPRGGTDCAHPVQTAGLGEDHTEQAQGPNATGSQVKAPIADQYAVRHNPFVYFHSVIDDARSCARHVVPLGTAVTAENGKVAYRGRLADDLRGDATTPRFAFITPNLCDDAHDASCAGANAAGTTVGGLVAADLWMRTWMPLILGSPAYRNGTTLVVITFDEAEVGDTTAGDHETPGPNSANPGYSVRLNTPLKAFGGKTYYQVLGITSVTPGVEPPPGTMPGGGHIGAVLLNPRWIEAGSVDTTGEYNHYSALRTYEDLLGLREGGADGKGHLGFAATATSFGADVFNARPGRCSARRGPCHHPESAG